MLTQMARHWWTLTIRGVLAIIFGLIALFHPGAALAALALLLGAYLFTDGVFALLAAARFSHQDGRWRPLILEGVFGILIGIVMFLQPAAIAVALIFIIAAWAILTGLLEITAAIQLRRVIANEWTLILTGIISLILGIALLIHPGVGLLASAWLLGVYALLFGLLLIALSLRLRRLETAAP